MHSIDYLPLYVYIQVDQPISPLPHPSISWSSLNFQVQTHKLLVLFSLDCMHLWSSFQLRLCLQWKPALSLKGCKHDLAECKNIQELKKCNMDKITDLNRIECMHFEPSLIVRKDLLRL